MPFRYTMGPHASYSSGVAVALSAPANMTQVRWHICALSYYNDTVLDAPTIRHPTAKIIGFQTRDDGLHMAVFAVPQNSNTVEGLSVSVGAGVAGLRNIITVEGADQLDPVEAVQFTVGSGSTISVQVVPGGAHMARIDFLAALTDSSTGWATNPSSSATAGVTIALGGSAMAMNASYHINENAQVVSGVWSSLSSAAQWIHCAIALKPYNGTL